MGYSELLCLIFMYSGILHIYLLLISNLLSLQELMQRNWVWVLQLLCLSSGCQIILMVSCAQKEDLVLEGLFQSLPSTLNLQLSFLSAPRSHNSPDGRLVWLITQSFLDWQRAGPDGHLVLWPTLGLLQIIVTWILRVEFSQ